MFYAVEKMRDGYGTDSQLNPIEQIGKTLRGAMGAMKSISVGVERMVELEEA